MKDKKVKTPVTINYQSENGKLKTIKISESDFCSACHAFMAATLCTKIIINHFVLSKFYI